MSITAKRPARITLVRPHETTRRMPTGQFPALKEIRCDFVNLCMDWPEASSTSLCHFVTRLTIPDRRIKGHCEAISPERRSGAANAWGADSSAPGVELISEKKVWLGTVFRGVAMTTVGLFMEFRDFELSKRRRWFCST